MSSWGKLGIAIGGAIIGGIVGGPVGMQVGFLAGSFLGNQIFPTEYESEMPPVHDYPVQKSAAGISIPIAYGTRPVAGNVIWMGDLIPYQIKHKASGGKGGGDEQVSYETKYRRSFLIAICEGKATIIRAWKGKEEIDVTSFTSFDGENNSGIGTLTGEDYSEYNNLCCAFFQDYELGNSQALPNFVFEVTSSPVPIADDAFTTGDDGQVAFDNNTWYAQAFTASSSYTIQSVKLKLFRIGLIGNITVELQGATGSPPIPNKVTLATMTFDGDTITTDSAGAWYEFTFITPYSVTSGIEYCIVVETPNADGTSKILYWRDVGHNAYLNGNCCRTLNAGDTWSSLVTIDCLFEIRRLISGDDLNFAEMIKDLLTNPKCGGYSTDDLITKDFDDIISYCQSNGLKGSLVITQQKPLPDWIAYICSHFQGYFYEIGGKIGLNCYRDQASVLSITQDDLVREGDEPPVHITKRKYSQTFNRMEATWTDRNKDYKTAVVPAFDVIDQRESGQVRTKTMDLKAITNATLASKMTWRIFIDQVYRFSQYTFKLGYKSMLLEVGDVIDVTDGHILVSKKMRVVSVAEGWNGRIASITAIEDISGLYPSISYIIQESQSATDADITLTDGTIIFREDIINNKLYLSIVPGGTQCNGFYIYRSYDDVSYDLVGKAAIGGITGGEANSTGILQNPIYLPAHTAVIHRENEFFEVDIGTLTDLDTSITDDDFFNNRKLAKIGDEIIAYKTCVESSVEGVWRVSNIIRGLFGTRPVAHSAGETFSTLDIDGDYILQESDIGKTLYFKVVSFYAKKIQLVSEVSSTSYQVKGLWKRPASSLLVRLTSDENGRSGIQYTGSSFTLYWTLPSQKGTGFNQGGFDLNTIYPTFRYGDDVSKLVGGNGVQFGSYLVNQDLQGVNLVFEKTDGTFISQRSVGPTVTSAVINKSTDLGNNATAVIKVYPRKAQRSEKAESITVTGV